MPKPVKVILVLAFLIGGIDAARDYFLVYDSADSTSRWGKNISFWSFVAMTVGLIGYFAYRRIRARK